MRNLIPVIKDNLNYLEQHNIPIIPEPLITGDDLIEHGFKPGSRFRVILREVETLQLDDELNSPKDNSLALPIIDPYIHHRKTK